MNKILVVGDVIEDVIAIPAGAIRANTDTPAKIEKSMGGSAANVASWLAYLSASVSFVGCVSEADLFTLQQQLRLSGIETELQSSSKATGSLIVLVEGENRTMLTDRGANQDLNLGLIDPTAFSMVYVSGYALLGRSAAEIQNFFDKIKAAEARLAIDPGSYGFIEDYGVGEFRELMLHADIVFPNQQEEELLELSGKVPLTVITKGEDGATAVFESGATLTSSLAKTELIDPTGAGDAFCAGFLASLVSNPHGLELEANAVKKALDAGVFQGAMAVAQIGARPQSRD